MSVAHRRKNEVGTTEPCDAPGRPPRAASKAQAAGIAQRRRAIRYCIYPNIREGVAVYFCSVGSVDKK